MKKKFNFATDRIAKLTCSPNKNQELYRDEKTPGFGIRVTRSGSKSFIFEGSLHGKTIRITIGDVRNWRMDDARKEANKMMVLVDQGKDPRAIKAETVRQMEVERVVQRRQETLVQDAWDAYILANSPRWGERHRQAHLEFAEPGGRKKKRSNGLTKAGPLTAVLQLPMIQLTHDAIARWMEKEKATRATSARHAFVLLRAFANWCESEDAYRDLIPSDAFKAKKVKDNLPKAKAKRDCLQKEHLPDWFKSIQTLENVIVSAYLQTLLLIGARRRELALLKWSDVNFNFGGSITLRDKGTTFGDDIGTRTIPMTPYVQTLLNGLPRRNEYVFSSMDAESGHIESPNRAQATACKRAGIPHVSLHGLRRSFKTLSQWIELPVGITDQIMGHAPQGVGEMHYMVRPLDMLRMYHERIEAWILKEAAEKKPKESTPVIQLAA